MITIGILSALFFIILGVVSSPIVRGSDMEAIDVMTSGATFGAGCIILVMMIGEMI